MTARNLFAIATQPLLSGSLNLYGKAALGCRKVARVLDVFFALFDQTVPHHTTIRLWILQQFPLFFGQKN
jgi:hypothetical protein